MYTPIEIADFFLKKGLQSNTVITPLKLIKLVYIAHGWHLGFLDQPLFKENVQAWKYGPVIPIVYYACNSYGNKPIKELISYENNIPLSAIIPDTKTRVLLTKIWERYCHLSGVQLSSLTHQPDTPWDITWNKNDGYQTRHTVIPNKLIEKHYKEKINAGK